MDLSYDRNSNITWAEDAIHTGFDVKYTLDDLNRLVMAEEGTESSGSIASRTRQELWTLTQTGNWELFKRDINGNNAFNDTGDFNDDRTHNVVNELTARDIDDNGSDNYTLTYDATGNLTDDGESYTYVYDAWYRLRKVKNAATSALIAELTYYGNNHRKGHHYDVDGDGTVEDTSDDPWVYFAWNERWQLLATFTGSTSTPAEEWVIHQAGLDGRGGSSYIDDVILRDRDTDGNGSLDERRYLCQNWRHDLSAIVTDTGKMVEWVKYSSYGEPLALPAGDTDSDGDWDATDSGAIAGGYDVRKDAELDGDVDASDITHANSITGGYQTLGRTVLSSTAVTNRKGYAGYERDHSIPVVYHVRHRVLHTTLGRWTRRDPLGYVDGVGLYGYARSRPLAMTDSFGLLGMGFGTPDDIPPYDAVDCWMSCGACGLALGWAGGVIAFCEIELPPKLFCIELIIEYLQNLPDMIAACKNCLDCLTHPKGPMRHFAPSGPGAPSPVSPYPAGWAPPDFYLIGICPVRITGENCWGECAKLEECLRQRCNDQYERGTGKPIGPNGLPPEDDFGSPAERWHHACLNHASGVRYRCYEDCSNHRNTDDWWLSTASAPSARSPTSAMAP